MSYAYGGSGAERLVSDLTTVRRGVGLAIKDLTGEGSLWSVDWFSHSQGSSDPYCVVTVDGKDKKKTQVVDKNLNPFWCQSFFL